MKSVATGDFTLQEGMTAKILSTLAAYFDLLSLERKWLEEGWPEQRETTWPVGAREAEHFKSLEEVTWRRETYERNLRGLVNVLS